MKEFEEMQGEKKTKHTNELESNYAQYNYLLMPIKGGS